MNGDTHMEQQPTVSVVVPVYNAQTDLKECLDSISKQTLKNWEAILVDDGSTDGSAAILDAAAKKDPRFRVIHKQNAGVSRARNDGIDAACGKYVMFIDADDLVQPTYFQKMVDAAETYGTDLVVCDFERLFDTWTSVSRAEWFHVGLSTCLREFLIVYTESKLNMYGVSIWAKLFHRDMLNEHQIRFDPAITYEEDCNFIADCLAHVQTVAALGDVLYGYRQQEESLSKGYRKDTFRFLVNGFQRRCRLIRENGMEEYLPNLKSIFFSVVKSTSQKIARAGFNRSARIAEYESMLTFPEVQDAAIMENKSHSGLTNRIRKAICKKNAKMLDRIMQRWLLEDKLVDFVKSIKKRIENRGKQA